MKFSIKATILILIFGSLLGQGALAQESAKDEIPLTKIGIIDAIIQQIASFRSYSHDSRETKKARDAVEQEKKKLSTGESRQLEIVSKGGPLMAGGTFVRVQEVKPGAKLDESGIFYSSPFPIEASLPAKEFTPEEKKEMKKRAEEAKRAEKLLNKVEVNEKKLKEVREAAEKARTELEAKEAAKLKFDLALKTATEEKARIAKELEQKKQNDIRTAAEKARAELEASQAAATAAAAAQAARVADEARAKAARDAANAEKRERIAENNGREIMREIQNERARFRAEGGNFRAPSSR